MWWQVDGHRLGVDDPTEDELDGGPRTVPLPQLLEGDWLAAKRAVRCLKGAEDRVNGVQKDASYPAVTLSTLREGDKIINEHVYVF